MTEIRSVREEEIAPALFRHFIRHQVVTKCWRKEKGDWVVRDIPFIDDWNKEAYEELVSCLKHTVRTGGFLCGAFQNGQLKGFVSVESGFLDGPAGIWTYPASMFRKMCVGRGSAADFSMPQNSGQGNRAGRRCIFLLIHRWKVRHSTSVWAARKPGSIRRSMWKRNPMTVSWSVCCKRL